MIRKLIIIGAMLAFAGCAHAERPKDFQKEIQKPKLSSAQVEQQLWNTVEYWQNLLKLNQYERQEILQNLQKARQVLSQHLAPKEPKK